MARVSAETRARPRQFQTEVIPRRWGTPGDHSGSGFALRGYFAIVFVADVTVADV